jgi:hypothetical protein
MTDETTVEIFHHASFLKHVQNQLFPVGLLEETLRTLSLLFPPTCRSTLSSKDWAFLLCGPVNAKPCYRTGESNSRVASPVNARIKAWPTPIGS